MDRYEKMEHLREELGDGLTLEEMVDALSEDEMEDLYDYICRMESLTRRDEEEEEDEEDEDDE